MSGGYLEPPRRRLLLLTCLLAAWTAEAAPSSLDDQLQAVLDEAVEAGLPAVSASVVSEEHGWVGVAGETSASSGAALGAQAPFRIASITKLFTAVVVLQLVDTAQLQLDDTLAELLPTEVPHAASITVSMLLDHTSGVRDFTDDRAFWREAYGRRGLDRTWEPEELIAYSSRGRPSFEPGATGQSHYSSTNYILLGCIIERVTGEPLAQVYRTHILEPLGMTNTLLEGFEPGMDTVQHSLLKSGPGQRLLARKRGWKRDARAGVHDMSASYAHYNSWAWAAGGLSSSAADLDRFLGGLAADGLLEQGTLDVLVSNNSGVGEFGRVFGGSGGWDGITASAYDIAGGVRIVVLANGTGFGVDADTLRNRLFEVYRARSGP